MKAKKRALKSLFFLAPCLISSLFSSTVQGARTYSTEKIKKEMYCGKENSFAKSGNSSFDLSKEGITMPKLSEMFSKELLNELKEKKKNQKRKQLGKNAITREVKGEVSSYVDLSKRDTPVKKQWGGTCTSFGLVAVMENMINNPTKAHLSENHLWSQYEEYYVGAALTSAQKEYITEEDYWPQWRDYPYGNYLDHAHTKLKKYRYINDDINEAVRIINSGRPVYIGMTTSLGMYNGDAVIDPCTEPTEGGHAFALVGYQLDDSILGGGYFIVKNSWGTSNGDNGYQYMPFYHCERDDMYCMMYDIQEIETKYSSLNNDDDDNTDGDTDTDEDTNAGFPVGFDFDLVSVNTDLYVPWYSSTHRLKVKLDAPKEQLEFIQSVSYELDDENGLYVEKVNRNSKFYHKFKVDSDYLNVKVKITFVNGQEYLMNSIEVFSR